MGNELAIDGVKKGCAIAFAVHPRVVDEVAEFFHVVMRCLAKVAGAGWIHLAPVQNSKWSSHLGISNHGIRGFRCFDEQAISVDEKKDISRQHAWEIQICFSIFIAMTVLNHGLTL